MLEIRELFHNSYFINYSIIRYDKVSIIKSTDITVISDIISIEPIFSSISIHHILSSEEFKLIWELIQSRRTRFKISYINLKFKLLSKCLNMLSLCRDCPELQFIYFEYLESDVKYGHTARDNAIKDFRKKFGFISMLSIIKWRW